MRKIPILLDVDTGVDDAMTIMVAAQHPKLDLLGVTATFGNTTLEHTLQNTLNVLKLCGRGDVPVAAGLPHAMVPVAPERLGTHIHGIGGLGSYHFEEDTKEALSPLPSWELSYNLLRGSAEPVVLCYMGSLTTAAILLEKYPDIKEKIKCFVYMGGQIRQGTLSPLSSVNLYHDPYAAKVVLRSGIPFYMVAGDTTSASCYLKYEEIEWFKKLRSPVAKMICELFDSYGEGKRSTGLYPGNDGPTEDGRNLHDPSTILFLTNPENYTYGRYYGDMEISSKLAVGMTYIDYQDTLKKPMEEKNVFYVDKMVDREYLRDLFYEAIARYDEVGEDPQAEGGR